jgi:hypothetical protein
MLVVPRPEGSSVSRLPRARCARSVARCVPSAATGRARCVPRAALAIIVVVIAQIATGCEGQLGSPATGPGRDPREPGPGPGPTVGPVVRPISPGPAPVRRMTGFEYDNTIRDLLGDTTAPARDFGAEEEANGFNNNAANLVTTSALADKYMRAAEGIAERATADLAALLPCDPAALGEEPCARQFVATFLRRAFRRPATEEEVAAFSELYLLGRATDFRTGIAMVIEAALQSPQFLYRIEPARIAVTGETEIGDPAPLDAFELASRLSYFLWGTMPDEPLLLAAEEGRLATAADVEREARRLLADPHARDVVAEFHRQWLDYDRVHGVGKDATLFPTWSPAIGALMADETHDFVERAIFEGDGTLGALLTAPSTAIDPELAAFYGPGDREGLLMQGSLLAYNAHSDQTSPVHRGLLVRTRFLCDPVPPPPAEFEITVPEPAPGSTARERFAQHSADPACSGCHVLMDPLGFGFEAFDGVGRFRTEEAGAAIDVTGMITESDVDGSFAGVEQLAARLSSSDEVARCYSLQWLRYAYGRGESSDDAGSIAEIDAAFAASGGDVLELLVALTQTDAFLYRRVEEAR